LCWTLRRLLPIFLKEAYKTSWDEWLSDQIKVNATRIQTYGITIQLFYCQSRGLRRIVRYKTKTTTSSSILFDHDADAK
jgi:hypothetical protein